MKSNLSASPALLFALFQLGPIVRLPARWIKSLRHQHDVLAISWAERKGRRSRGEGEGREKRAGGRKMETNAWGIALPEPFLIII